MLAPGFAVDSHVHVGYILRRMRLFNKLLRMGTQARIPNVGERVLAPYRRRALDETLLSVRPRVDALVQPLELGQPAARDALANLADEALGDMRARTRTYARQAGWLHGALAEVDARWADTDEGEYIDDPSLDPALRLTAMRHLDEINALIGSYEAFLDLLRPAMSDVCGRARRALRVIDLAAGHGGFALALARAVRERGDGSLEITATDIKREYLDLGERIAREEGLPVSFQVQDALDLSNIEAGEFDVVLCTQSLHHFSAGAVVMMIREAARVAGHSVLFIDGARVLAGAVFLHGYMRSVMRDPVIAHDAWVSCRRFFAPEELLLLARLGPWGERARVRGCKPLSAALELATI